MKIIKARKPKNYLSTNLYFSNSNSANEYVNNLNKNFILRKAESLEMNISKRKKKNLYFSKPEKYLLTKVGSQFLLWKELH